MKNISYILLLFFIFSGSSGNAAISDGDIHKVKPRNGDGIQTFLSRYEIYGNKVLRDLFYDMNQLSSTSRLYQHKKYQLPIYLYNYNGKSIRSTIGIDDWDKAVRIKEYNELLLKKGVRSTHYTASKILWVPINEVNRKTDIAPSDRAVAHKTSKAPPSPTSSSSVATDHLYGSKYENIKVLDHSLANKVFYVVSGHGGPDPGAICKDYKTKLCEDEYAYDISLRLARNLRQHGAIVEMVIQDEGEGIRDNYYLRCDKSERLADGSRIPLGQLKRLQQRTNYINRKYEEYKKRGITDQKVISLHIDSNSESHQQDVFFCYYKKSKSSKELAIQLRDKFQEKYGIHQKNRGYKGYLHERGFYVLRKTKPPAVLIELANIRNKYNHKRILQKENRQALANWIYEGLAQNTGINARLIASSN